MKNLALLCTAYGLIGCFEDYLVSWYYLFVAQRRAVPSALISWVHTLLAVFVIAGVITSNSVLPLLCYATGGAAGTYAGVKWNKK